VLDVLVDGRVVFSKKAEGRIPPASERIRLSLSNASC